MKGIGMIKMQSEDIIRFPEVNLTKHNYLLIFTDAYLKYVIMQFFFN